MAAQTVNYTDLENRIIGLGIATAVTGILAGILLQFTRRIRNMPSYFKSNFSAFRGGRKLPILMTILYYIFLITPLILLLVWVILLGANIGVNPCLPVLFTGLFIIVLFLPSYSSLFYVKSMVLLVLFLVAQILTMSLIFSKSSLNSFFALTAMLLTLNSIFVAIALWLIDGNSWSLPHKVNSDIQDDIMRQVKIWKQKEQPPQIISGGLYVSILQLSKIKKVIITVVAYLLSLIVLMTYSLVGYYHTSYQFQALVNSVAVVTTDIITFMLIFITKSKGFNPIFNVLVCVALRACIVGFTGQYWFLGYCLLYLLLNVYIVTLIINKYYPQFEKLPILAVSKSNIFKMPQMAYLILLLMFGGLIYFMGNDNGTNLPIATASINGVTYPFWAIGVATILLSISLTFYLMTLRIIQRSRDKIRSINHYYMGCHSCSQYYFLLFFSYVFLVVLGVYLYFQVNAGIIWASCVFLPLFYQLFVIFYTNWKENDYLLLGDHEQYNKKLDKRKAREQKMDKMKNSMMKNIKIEDVENQEMERYEKEAEDRNIMSKAKIEDNVMVFDDKSYYSDWRDEQINVLQALRQDRLLPTDKRIIISLPLMILILVGYSIAFFFASGNQDVTAFTISVEILCIFLCFIPVKRYFSTFERPNVGQIISFILGVILNYTFGGLSYGLNWNRTPAYTCLWTFANIFLISAYAAFSMLRDKGLVVPSIISCVITILLSFGIGIILLAVFSMIPEGLALLGAAFFYTYAIVLYLIYLKRNKSMPWILYPITALIIVLTCFAVMIYAFVVDTFDNFYGFSITYLVVNLLILLYACYLLYSDMMNRFDRPNFYSAYGSPVYKYDNSLKSVTENMRPLKLWLAAWFMFYGYTLLMQIFIADTNIGIAAQQIFLVVFFLTFIYFVTYNVYRGGTVSKDITDKVIQQSWEEIKKFKQQTVGNYLDIDQIEETLEKLYRARDSGEEEVPSSVKINPRKNEEMQSGQSAVGEDENINLVIYQMEDKLEKAKQNDRILLVNLWTKIIFRCESTRKKKMLKFINFIRDQGQTLANIGVMIVLESELYDIESIYNQAYQEYLALAPLQKIQFDKHMKVYGERKQKEADEKEEANKKQNENHLRRQEELEKKFGAEDVDDSDLPIQKMRDSPLKFKKMKETLTTDFTDSSFSAGNENIPGDIRGQCKGWRRPSSNSVVLKDGNAGMKVRQGSIGDCYLISAIGALGKDKIKKILGDPTSNPPGAHMVKFNKFNRDIHMIIDNQFPVYDTSSDNKWLFGRSEDEKQIFCNVIEKAYAKLYGGYQNIVGGKVALALSQMTGGFPQEIQLKPYQDSNTNQIFEKMLQFKKSGYLMGAGSPPNADGDSVQIDGIYQSHAYLVLDVRNLDGNKIMKLRNPHGDGSTQSTLDWSDKSPKWTKRLKGLIGEQLGADGAFWMGLDDFVYCYRALYVCRIFDPNEWKKVGPFHGEWKGQKAAGLKSKSGRAQLHKNPHFGIKVNKNCTLFIQLTQKELQNGRAKNKIFFMVQKNNGNRIEAPVANKMAGMSGAATNSKTISKEINLNANSYPYTFSLMTSIYEAGVQGSFSLMMYCDDMDIEVIEDDKFDR